MSPLLLTTYDTDSLTGGSRLPSLLVFRKFGTTLDIPFICPVPHLSRHPSRRRRNRDPSTVNLILDFLRSLGRHLLGPSLLRSVSSEFTVPGSVLPRPARTLVGTRGGGP